MATVPDSVRSPADVDDRDALERDRVAPSDLGEVTVENPEDGQPEVTVPISSTAPHRSDGKIMTEEALEAMAEQLQSGEIGLWDDHGLSVETGWREYRREDMYGKWVDGEVEDGVLWATAELMEDRDETESLLGQLDQDMPVGFSVGYKPLEEEMLADGEEDGEKPRHIYDVDLWETSSVGIPDNPTAIAMAGAIEAELDQADVTVTPAVASTVATSVREGVESAMSDTHPDESTDPADTTADGGTASTDPDPDAAAGETRDLAEEQVDEVMDVVDSVFSAARDAIRSELAESDEDDDDDEDEDDEEESAADVDLDTSSGGEGADPQSDLAELRERLDQVEQRNEDLEERLEEKEATIDRLESETRESAGRKGISPAASGGSNDTDGGEGADSAETRDPSDQPTNTLEEAMRLSGE